MFGEREFDDVVISMAVQEGITVFFLRHGTSEWNLLKKWQGQTDTLLAPEGESQALETAAKLRDVGIRFDIVRCSDLNRAARTAELVTGVCGRSHTGQPVDPTVDSRLRECSLGVFEGLHKDEIFGPRFAFLFKRLSRLPHEARIRESYFVGLETPLQISSRALQAATEAAQSAPIGGTVACVTHSVILESLCAAAFHKDFESVHTKTLAWLKCKWTAAAGFSLVDVSGVAFATSPDALALDPGAATLHPAPAVPTTSTAFANATACGTGVVVFATSCGALLPRMRPTAAAAASLAVGAGVVRMMWFSIGANVRDARTTAVAKRGAFSLMMSMITWLTERAAGAMVSSDCIHHGLRFAHFGALAHAGAAFASVAASEILVGFGWRASLRASPLGLWLPHVVVIRAATISGTMEDVPTSMVGIRKD